MSTTPEAPAPPGQPLPTAPPQEGNIFLNWVAKNWSTLLLLATAIVVGTLVNYVLPALRERSRLHSWDLYQELVGTQDAFTAENLPETLGRSREDDRIHRWVVEQAVRTAMFLGDREALEILRAETQALVDEEAFAGIAIAAPDGVHNLGEYLRDRVQEELASETVPTEFQNPEPRGRRVRLVLRDGQEQEYSLVIGLYEEAAPAATAAFLAALEAGRISQLEAQPLGASELRFSGLADPEAAAGGDEASLPLERQWGYFHLAGALATVSRPDLGPGAQSEDQFALLLADRPFSDGRATVFGKVVAGEDRLQALEDAVKANPQGAGVVLVEAALVEEGQ